MTVQIQKAYQYYQGPILANTELPIIEFTFIDNSHVSAKIRNNNPCPCIISPHLYKYYKLFFIKCQNYSIGTIDVTKSLYLSIT